MEPKIPSFATIFLAFLAIFLFASASAHSAPHSCGKKGDEVNFGYTGASGPKNWSHLSSNFSLCNKGKLQSPINILKNETVPCKNLAPLTRNYHSANATLVNFGYTIKLVCEAGALVVDDKNYTLKQMHWHTPSEHLIDGIQYPAELHLVHMASDGSFVVVGVLYKFGKPNHFLSKLQGIFDELRKEKCGANEESQVVMGKMRLRPINRNIRKYYRYTGSLTTPPCSENVVWIILPKVRPISRGQVEALEAPLKTNCKHNCRPVQPLSGRRVEIYSAPHAN